MLNSWLIIIASLATIILLIKAHKRYVIKAIICCYICSFFLGFSFGGIADSTIFFIGFGVWLLFFILGLITFRLKRKNRRPSKV